MSGILDGLLPLLLGAVIVTVLFWVLAMILWRQSGEARARMYVCFFLAFLVGVQ